MLGAQRIVAIALGYVGLALAVALARHLDTMGFDIHEGGAVMVSR
jgi:UDP-N-acetyl-D-mannosaminuronate dehydrogenase